MKSYLTRAAAWFSDSRRAALQALIATSTTLLVIVGAATTEQASALTDLGAAGLVALQGVIGLALLRRSEWATWFSTSGRAVIYGAAVAVGVAGGAFHLWGGEVQAQIAAIATAVLSILTAFVQVLNTQTLHLQLGEVAPTYLLPGQPSWTVLLADRPRFLRVVVYGTRQRVSDAEIRGAVAPDEAGGVTRVARADEARGISADVVLSTVPLVPGLEDALRPIVAQSTVADPIRYLP